MAAVTTWWKSYKEAFQQETLARLLFDLHEKHGEFERKKHRVGDIDF